ncbi:hypothetical protein [Lentzea sp. NBRC 102530]|uniref:hypothetical protein n=1 Tax=Lentzea sp. NBRC 102530 TaxID=3032201 RepID=UPI0024A24DA3|nr:hypothetical protein [Lentzea sp. NBRC 102530]GLY51317.1 hypothetical protein Lesp01_49730 [Lentzea sp. NBRC 102530]
MSNPTGSNVSEIRVRTSGEVLCRVDLYNVGNPNMGVSVRLGDVTVRVHELEALNELHYVWAVAEDEMSGLPGYYEDVHAGGNPGLHRAHVLVDLPGVPTRTCTRIPKTSHSPAHLRIQFGPIAWEVTDYMAWRDCVTALTNAINAYDAVDPR